MPKSNSKSMVDRSSSLFELILIKPGVPPTLSSTFCVICESIIEADAPL